MMSTKDRLEHSFQVLDVLDQRRRKTGDLEIGCGIERFIINRELSDLEEEILANPGALEALLVRVRRR